MTPDGLLTTLAQVIDRLTSLAAADPELRSLLNTLARQLVEATEPAPPVARPEGQASTSVAAQAAPGPLEPAAIGFAEPEPAPTEREQVVLPHDDVYARPASLPARYASHGVEPARRPLTDVPDEELRLIQVRCQLKAKGARWAAKRRRQLAEGADPQLEIEPIDRQLVEEARLANCFLWPNHPNGPAPTDLTLLDDLGGCFETTADGIELALLLLADPDPVEQEFEDCLYLLAEAQAALRVAVLQVGYSNRDPDQINTFYWIRGRCHDAMIYISRYMRLGDDADPADWADLGQRIEAKESAIRGRQQSRRERESALKRIAYHLKPILRQQPGESNYDWQKILETIDEIVPQDCHPAL